MRPCHLSDSHVVSSLLDRLLAGTHPTPASSSYKTEESVRGDNVNPLLIFHGKNIGSHYMSPLWCLVLMHEILTFIMTFAGHTPNTQRYPGFYGEAITQ